MLHTDGYFYGTTAGGGPNGAGTVFRLSTDGALDVQPFTGNSGRMPGHSPAAPLIPSSDGWLWGSTQAGGHGTHGTVFRYKPETGAHQTIFNFMNSTALYVQGRSPQSALSRDDDGWLWGCAPGGSFASTGLASEGDGVIFKVHEATGIAEVLIGNANLKWTNGSGLYKGRTPHSVYAAPGTNYVWGMTSNGGTGSGARGTVFRIDRSTTPIGFMTVGEFQNSNPAGGAIQASGPTGRLVPDGLGYLWAVTQDSATAGSVFGSLIKVDMAGTTLAATTAPIQFTGTSGNVLGDDPLGSLVKDAGGLLWGATRNGGAANKGTVFKVDPVTNTLTTVVQFGSLTGPLTAVSNPVNPLTLDGNGYAWGLAQAAVDGPWTCYKVNLATGAVSLVKEFSGSELTPDGKTPLGGLIGKTNHPWIYGSTSTGGQFGFGTLYRCNIQTKVLETLVHFSGQTGATLGSGMDSRLHIHTDGTVWGATRFGGASNFGTVFKYDPATSTFTHLASFNGNNSGAYKGANPKGKLTTGGDGCIWGTTSAGNDGSIFKVNPATNVVSIFKVLTTTNRPEGTRIEGGLAADSSGNLWGFCERGGDLSVSGTGYGVIYKIDPVAGTYTVVVKFTGSAGAIPGQAPVGDPVFDAEGKLWGKFSNGAFKYDITANTVTTVPVTEISTYPPELAVAGNYYRHSDGLLYGTLTSGGLNADGSSAGGGRVFRLVEGYPAVSAGAPTDAPYPTIVQLNGGVALNGGSGTYQFEWGTSTALGQATPALTSPAALSANLSLSGQTIYYFRSRANGPNGPVYSPVVSFITRQINAEAEKEIIVESPLGIPLQDNVSAVNLGSHPVGRQVKQAVVIRNIGQSGLTGLTASLNGTGSGHFTISPLAVTSLPAMGTSSPLASPSAYVYVTYTPDAEGTHNAVLTLTSNDTDEASFEVLLNGTGVVDPDIRVEQPVGTVLSANGSSTVDFGGSVAGSAAANISFLIKNIGLGTLSGVSAALSGPHAGDFSIVTPSAASVASQGSSSLVLGFTPSASGVRSALLTIASNDPDQPGYQIALTGLGTGAPEMVLEYPAGTNVNSGGSVAFGTVAQGGSLIRTFTIRNTGNAPLNVTAAIQGQPQYQIFTPPPGTIAAGASATFEVRLTPFSVVPVIATMRLTTNDADEGTFDVTLNGSGAPATVAELDVEEAGGGSLTNGASVNFGAVSVGSSSSRTFTIRNTGTDPLTLAAELTGGAPEYSITASPAASVAAGGSTAVTVVFTPSATGVRAGTLRLTSNDSDEGTFDLALTGTAEIGSNPLFPPNGQPASRVVIAGQGTTLSPVVTGADPKTYQWRKNNGNIAGNAAKLPSYVIAAAKASDAGSYTVVVSNAHPPAATSPVIQVGVVAPLPASVMVNEGAVLTLTCTATAPPGHTLAYQWKHEGQDVSGNSTATAKVLKVTGIGAVAAGTYTCVVTMTAGSAAFSGPTTEAEVTVLTKPVLSAVATPDAMLVSETVNVSPLTTVGGVPATFAAKGLPPGVKLDPVTGIFSGKPTAAKAYLITLTAKNSAGTSAPVQVTWTVNPFTEVGTFHGLVERNDIINDDMGGVIQITTTATGTVSGSATLAGKKYPVTGVLDTSAGDDTTATLLVKRPAALGNLTVTLTLETGADRLSGEIRKDGEEAEFNARRNTWTTASPVGVGLTGNYTAGITLVLPATPDYPLGDGYATLSIAKNGTAKWAGKAGDGSAFTFSTILGPDREVILHAMLYKNTGSLQGVSFIDGVTGDLASVQVPAFDWFKAPQPQTSKDRLYKDGFEPHPVNVIGGRYQPASHVYNFFEVGGGSSPHLVLSELAVPFNVPLTIVAPSKLTVGAVNGTKLSINASTGV
ncbi:MAG TPA: choice-of-anchor tandem repeat GloVer-containing protein, partial [Prosthecobacter sp.]